MHSGNFWNLLEHSEMTCDWCNVCHWFSTWTLTGTFWNILEQLVTNVMSVTDFQLELKLELWLEHSGTFWNILEWLVTNVMSVTDLQLELQLEHSCKTCDYCNVCHWFSTWTSTCTFWNILEWLVTNVMSVTDFQLADGQTDRNISDRHYITM